jgi:hypothetical protein
MVVHVGCCDREGPGLPEKGVPCDGGIGEEAVPTVNPVLGLPTPNLEFSEPDSAGRPQHGLIETGEVEGMTHGLEEEDGRAAGCGL